MAISKVEYAGTTLIDLTGDNVTEDTLVKGSSAHAKTGMVVNGTLITQHYFTGTTAPSESIGQDGDIYLKVGS